MSARLGFQARWWTALPGSARVVAWLLGAAAVWLFVSALIEPVPAYGGSTAEAETRPPAFRGVLPAAAFAADTPSVHGAGLPIDTSAMSTHAVQRRGGRPFAHQQHERVSCQECHGTGARHGVRVMPRCAACHHDERRATGCAACHDAAQLSDVLAVPTRMTLDVWDGPRVRTLPFNHEDHAGRTCQECHATPVTLARNRSCNACHAEHHRRETHCAACHAAIKPETHQAETHLSCAAAGCHAPGSLPSAVQSRNLCVLCHTAQVAHEPGQTCAECHLIPDGAALAERDRARSLNAREVRP